MKQIVFISCFIFLLVSCKKNKHTEQGTTEIHNQLEGPAHSNSGSINPVKSYTANLIGTWHLIRLEEFDKNDVEIDYKINLQAYLEFKNGINYVDESLCGTYNYTWSPIDSANILMSGYKRGIKLLSKDTLILSEPNSNGTKKVSYYSKRNISQGRNAAEIMLARKWVLKTKIIYGLDNAVQSSITYVNPKYNQLTFGEYVIWWTHNQINGWHMTRTMTDWDTYCTADTTSSNFKYEGSYKVLPNNILRTDFGIYTIDTLTATKLVLKTTTSQNITRYFLQ